MKLSYPFLLVALAVGVASSVLAAPTHELKSTMKSAAGMHTDADPSGCSSRNTKDPGCYRKSSVEGSSPQETAMSMSDTPLKSPIGGPTQMTARDTNDKNNANANGKNMGTDTFGGIPWWPYYPIPSPYPGYGYGSSPWSGRGRGRYSQTKNKEVGTKQDSTVERMMTTTSADDEKSANQDIDNVQKRRALEGENERMQHYHGHNGMDFDDMNDMDDMNYGNYHQSMASPHEKPLTRREGMIAGTMVDTEKSLRNDRGDSVAMRASGMDPSQMMGDSSGWFRMHPWTMHHNYYHHGHLHGRGDMGMGMDTDSKMHEDAATGGRDFSWA